MGKRETLLDRSQRLLGRALGKASESALRNTDTSYNPETDSKKSVPAAGRRDQVLQAQRTHRHRTQQYIRELEKEVIRFHDVEGELYARIKHLEKCLAVYRDSMLQQHVQPPLLEAFTAPGSPSVAGLEDSSRGFSPTGETVITTTTASSNASPLPVSVHSPVGVASTNGDAAATVPAQSSPPLLRPPTVSVNLTADRASLVSVYENNPLYATDPASVSAQRYNQQQQQARNGFSNGNGNGNGNNADSNQQHVMDSDSVTPAAQMGTQVAVDFVLGLEHPCLEHIRQSYAQMHPPRPPSPLLAPQPAPPLTSDDAVAIEAAAAANPGSGAGAGNFCGPHHLLSAAAPLYYYFRSQQEQQQSESGGGRRAGQVNAIEGIDTDPLLQRPMTGDSDQIERLLRTSLNLRLGGEVTPVQIWAKVKDMSRRRFVSVAMLDAMLRELGPHVYCNSFGAVVRQDKAEEILARIIDQGFGKHF